jgi:hypothetical protein
MIELTKQEIKWIKFCKGHLYKVYPPKKYFFEELKPLFLEIYGWNPDEDKNYSDYLECIFDKLYSIYSKITIDTITKDREIKELFSEIFKNKESELKSIEVGINKLCYLLRFSTVIDEQGNKIYNITDIKNDVYIKGILVKDLK